jgi:hypothetical protein
LPQPTKTPKTTKLKLSTPKDPNAAEKPKTSKAKKAAEKLSEEPIEEPVEEPVKEESPEVDPVVARELKQSRGM